MAEEKKLTNQEMKDALSQTTEQNNQMREYIGQLQQQLQRVSDASIYKRIDYLFAVIANEKMFPGGFVEACVDELVQVLTLPEKPVSMNEDKE